MGLLVVVVKFFTINTGNQPLSRTARRPLSGEVKSDDSDDLEQDDLDFSEMKSTVSRTLATMEHLVRRLDEVHRDSISCCIKLASNRKATNTRSLQQKRRNATAQ